MFTSIVVRYDLVESVQRRKKECKILKVKDHISYHSIRDLLKVWEKDLIPGHDPCLANVTTDMMGEQELVSVAVT